MLLLILALFCVPALATESIEKLEWNPPAVNRGEPADYIEAVNVTVKAGSALNLSVNGQTSIWHRELESGRREYAEAPYEDRVVANKWRGGDMGAEHACVEVRISDDGKLTMPKVSTADSAQYYTYYRGQQGKFVYEYFNVKVE